MPLSPVLGSAIPDAVIADIALFFHREQLKNFSKLSPRSNGVFKSYRIMRYTKVELTTGALFQIDIVDIIPDTTLKLRESDSNVEHIDDDYSDDESDNEETGRRIEIDFLEEDLLEKDPAKALSLFLSTCRSIDVFEWQDDPWFSSLLTENQVGLMINIKFKNIIIENFSISISFSLFLKFLHRHGSILNLNNVQLPAEFVSNKTLRLISAIDILPFKELYPVVQVTDDFLKKSISEFRINNFVTKFTMKGICDFLERIEFRGRYTFGTLDSNQLQNGINFAREHPNQNNRISLKSSNGQKTLDFMVYLDRGKNNNCAYSINLNTTKMDQFGMITVPENVFGLVTQQSFVNFDKIVNPEEPVQIRRSQYQLKSICFSFNGNLLIKYKTLRDFTEFTITRTSVTLREVYRIIADIFRNCLSINNIDIGGGIYLNEEFYQLLKPISRTITVEVPWNAEILLEPESFKELLEEEGGLLGSIDYIHSPHITKDVLPNEVLRMYLEKLYQIDVSLLPIELTSTGQETLLTDTLLRLISIRGIERHKRIDFTDCTTKFSAEGIQEFIKAASVVGCKINDVNLGIIDSSNVDEMKQLIKEFKKDEKTLEVTKHTVMSKGQLYCIANIRIRPGIRIVFELPQRSSARIGFVARRLLLNSRRYCVRIGRRSKVAATRLLGILFK